MSIFDNETLAVPAYVTRGIQKLATTFGNLPDGRFRNYEQILVRRGVSDRTLGRAVRLAEERWDRWQMPAALLGLCAEAHDAMPDEGPQKSDEEKRREWIQGGLDGWAMVLEKARAKKDEQAIKVACKEIDKARAMLDRIDAPDSPRDVEAMRAEIDAFANSWARVEGAGKR